MSNIEWTDATWNPVVGCTRVSAGCDNCYAVSMTRRLEGMAKAPGSGGRKQHYAGLTVLNNRGDRHFNGVVRCVEEAIEIPLRWKQPRRIFVNSMSDLFHKSVPFDFIDKVFAVMALCPQHTFQVLTKRPERMAEYLHCGGARRNIHVYDAASEVAPGWWDRNVMMAHARSSGEHWWPLPNVWLGTSCENQAAADERIPHLLRCPAVVRFLSCEPLIGRIDLDVVGDGLGDCCGISPVWHSGIGWVIVGGESGAKARPCNVEWIRLIVRQCKDASVPCFVKQLGVRVQAIAHHEPGYPDGATKRLALNDRKGGDPSEWPEDLRVREWPKGVGA